MTHVGRLQQGHFAAATRIEVDAAAKTVRFTQPSATLGYLPLLAGTKICVATWVYDAALRRLARDAATFAFVEVAGDNAPSVMDYCQVITLRRSVGAPSAPA